MSKNQTLKTNGTASELEEIYFMKENQRLLEKIRKKNNLESQSESNVVPLFTKEQPTSKKYKKAA